jgi:hypothetical protein
MIRVSRQHPKVCCLLKFDQVRLKGHLSKLNAILKEVAKVADKSLHRDVFGKLYFLYCWGSLSSEHSLEIFKLISNWRDHHLHADLLREAE